MDRAGKTTLTCGRAQGEPEIAAVHQGCHATPPRSDGDEVFEGKRSHDVHCNLAQERIKVQAEDPCSLEGRRGLEFSESCRSVAEPGSSRAAPWGFGCRTVHLEAVYSLRSLPYAKTKDDPHLHARRGMSGMST